ncbi:MAG: hypothetical protein E7422_01940 [Ruminococcaceae bacterium]|jgi:stage II sporulation protein M|nr:hypothetical protein [Oscillospiraceae bacterium]
MNGFARARKLRYVTVDILPLRSLLLALFLMCGIFAGYVVSGRLAGETGSELQRYFDGYLALAGERAGNVETAAQTVACFFRAPVLAFLFGFASIGVAMLPLLFAAQGFVLSFSLFSFAAAIGRESFLLLVALFAFRMLFVLPCTFVLGSAALEKSYALALLSVGGGKRTRPVVYGSPYWYRFAVCCVCLSVGSVLELWLVPLLLAA